MFCCKTKGGHRCWPAIAMCMFRFTIRMACVGEMRMDELCWDEVRVKLGSRKGYVVVKPGHLSGVATLRSDRVT